MSETESRTPDRTSFDNSNTTPTTASTTATERKEESTKNPDLYNSTSDYHDESESESEDEPESKEVSEQQSCSRTRPYVRGRKLSGPTSPPPPINSDPVTSNPSNLSVPMPTPPDEPNALLTATLIAKYATPNESPDGTGTPDTPTIVPESSKTELRSRTPTSTKCDDIKGSPDQKRDSESEEERRNEGETSAKPISIDPENPPETSPKLEKEILQLSEEVKTVVNNNKSVSCHNKTTSNLSGSGSRKGSKIPVGIAVAWQRLVTSMSTAGSLTTSVTSAPSGPKNPIANYHKLSELPSPPSPIKIPLRPSSASSITAGKVPSKEDNKVKRGSSGCGDSGSVHPKRAHTNISRKSYTPELNPINLPSRPLPSSSVPPNLGLGYLHGSLMDYHYGMRSATPYPSLSSPHHQEHGILPPSWSQQVSAADLPATQGFNSPGAAAAYLQQTMHNQMQLQQQLQAAHHQSYSNYSHPSASYLHPGFESFRQQYEQLLLHNHQQQQHSELLRQYHHHQQQQQHQQQQYQHHQQLLSSGGYESHPHRATPTLSQSGSPRISIPVLSPSPTGGVRTPTPTTNLNPSSHHSLSLSNLSPAGLPSSWPAELYHHNSSIALSPKSLKSSTPSPVTVQHDFSGTTLLNLVNSTSSGGGGGGSAFSGRKCPSPNPIPSKTFPLSSSSPITSSRKEGCKPVTDAQSGTKDLSTSTDSNAKDKDRPKNPLSPTEPDNLVGKSNGKLEQDTSASEDEHFGGENKKFDVSSIPGRQQSPSHKHDFTRMESLIEKRAQESVYLINQEEEEVKSKDEKGPTTEVEGNMKNEDVKHLVKIETDLVDPLKFLEKKSEEEDELVKVPPSPSKMIKSETIPTTTTSTSSPCQKPSVKSKSSRKPRVGKVETEGKKVQRESSKSLPPKEKVPKVPKIQKNSTKTNPDKPKRPSKKNKDLSEPGKGSPVRKQRAKKMSETRKQSTDSTVPKNKKKKREDYNVMIGNVVPDLILPVASSMSTGVSDNNRDKPNLAVGLSGVEATAEKAVLNGTVLLVTGVPRGPDEPQRETKPGPGSMGKYFISDMTGPKADNRLYSSRSPDNNPVLFARTTGEFETKPSNSNQYNSDSNNTYASQSNMTSDDQMRNRDSTTSTTTSMATLIITNPNQGIPLGDGKTISLSPVTISSPASVSIISSPRSNPHPGIQSSPLTLFLPKILPTGPISSHHQTSFKLVVSSQEIKIPAFVPSGSEQGTLQFYQQQQQATLQNINLVAASSSAVVTSSSFLVTPCDSESNTTPITPVVSPNISQPSPATTTYQTRQTILPTSYVESPPQQQSNIFSRKDFMEHGENHLNLLATVAQEFGAREDLCKLKIVSKPSTSFIGNDTFPSNLQHSINEEISVPKQPILSMQSPPLLVTSALTSPVPITLPTSSSTVQPKKPTTSATRYDEYEYDEKESTGNQTSSGSYKQAVWLKIPQVIPKAATKVAEKLPKTRRKQEKVPMKVTSKKPKTPKKKRDNNNVVTELGKSAATNDNTQTKSKAKPITQRAKGSPKKSSTKTEDTINKKDNLGISKLKIPKIPDSLTKLPTKRKESRSRSRSPEKSGIQQRKSSPQKATEHSSYIPLTKEPISMKMTLPVPKVAKIRIRLSETEEPTLLRHKSTNVSPCPMMIPNERQSFPNGTSNKKEKIKRRHSDEDKLSSKKRHRHNHHNQEDKSVALLSSDLVQNKNKKRNRSLGQESCGSNQNLFPTKDSKAIKTMGLDNNTVPVTTTKFTAEDLSSSFTSLTPPPTAKPLFEVGSPPSSQVESHPRFSLHEHENETETENENENDFSWVADPTFAVSAIRLSNAANHSYEGPAGHSRDDATGGGSGSRKPEKKDRRKSSKPSKLSLLNPRTPTQPVDRKTDLKSFVHLTSPPKRRISESKTQQRHHHTIKPRLKAEPIVRPLASLSGEDDSDAEIDLEVATLTKSISPTHKSSFYQLNLKKSQQQEAISISSNPIKNTSQTFTKCRKTKKRSLSSYSSKGKNFSRRLSLNLDRNRSNNLSHDTTTSEEELPDIVESYPRSTFSALHNPSTSSGQSSVNEAKQIYNNNHVIKESGSGFGSPSSWQPKRMPKKRSSRSSTATSTASEKPVSSNGLSRFSNSGGGEASTGTDILEDETLLPGKIELESVAELLDEMRILTEIQGLFYTGKLNALQPPDVYGVTLDNERGAPPHLIFSAEEVLEKCIREKKPQTLTVKLRICAYWSPQYSGLYPGRVSTDFNPHFDPEKDLIPIEFDDGDTGMIKLAEIRLLPANHPIRAYDPNPLLTLEKKHRKRRHSSTNTSSGPCTGDHEEADCGESFCAKVGKYEEEDDELKDTHHPFKSLYWTWTGLGYKRPKSKKNRHKEFFRGIQRGDEVINVGDSAIFISHGNERPYIGRVERFWEKKGQKVVNVRWFYHPEEVKSPRRVPHLKHPGALFESPHIDENDVQTIAKKCDVLPFPEFKERIGRMPKLSLKNSTTSSKPKDLYYVAGYYDPYTYNLQLKI